MSPWVKSIAAKPSDLSLIPREQDSCKLSSDLHTCGRSMHVLVSEPPPKLTFAVRGIFIFSPVLSVHLEG